MSQVVFITGGSSGIGKAIGEFLFKKGYKVFGTSRDSSLYPQSLFPLINMDLSDSESIASAVSELVRQAGTIDILINNAGVGITGPLEETPMKEIHYAMQVNLYGPMQVIHAVLPYMRAQKSGRILNITSIAGYMGLPYRGVYSASKGALNIITETYRMEVHPFGIEMCSVAPGDFATNIAAGRYHAPVKENSPYKTIYADSLKMMNEHVDKGGDPKQMAEAVYKILQKKKLKVHYKVGDRLQKISTILKGILPASMYEKMLKKHYKV